VKEKTGRSDDGASVLYRSNNRMKKSLYLSSHFLVTYGYRRLSRISLSLSLYDGQHRSLRRISKTNVLKITKMREENYQKCNVTINRLGNRRENDRYHTLNALFSIPATTTTTTTINHSMSFIARRMFVDEYPARKMPSKCHANTHTTNGKGVLFTAEQIRMFCDH
jgi:hypothetical protein